MAVTRERFTEILKSEGFEQIVIDYLWLDWPVVDCSQIIDEAQLQLMANRTTMGQHAMLKRAALRKKERDIATD